MVADKQEAMILLECQQSLQAHDYKVDKKSQHKGSMHGTNGHSRYGHGLESNKKWNYNDRMYACTTNKEGQLSTVAVL